MSEPVEPIVRDGRQRRGEWRDALEPPEGCSFTVFVQNPYIDTANPDAYVTTIRISRPKASGDPRTVRVAPLQGAAANATVFGDDEIYVANYEGPPPYDDKRPYYFPADETFLAANRPPRSRPTKLRELSLHQATGCFDCLKPAALFADDPRKTLSFRPNPIAAPDFGVAMSYAVARRALDIWKIYLDWDNRFTTALERPFRWYFQEARERLEIVPCLDEGTLGAAGLASSGFGFIQLGWGSESHHAAPLFNTDRIPEPGGDAPSVVPYWLNCDVLTHELGHQLLYSTLGFGPEIKSTELGPSWLEMWAQAGLPNPRENGDAFRAFHEAFSDMVALIVSLHFRPFLKKLVRDTKGDIFSVNAATSVGEVSVKKTIRNTMNTVRLVDVPQPSPDDDAERLTLRYYQLSQVISGALFDVLAGFAARYLTHYDVLPASVVEDWQSADDEWRLPDPETRAQSEEILIPVEENEAVLTRLIHEIYEGPDGPLIIENAIVRARDALGWLLGGYLSAKSGEAFDPAAFTLGQFKTDLAAVARGQTSPVESGDEAPSLTGETKAEIVARCFEWRGIQ